MSDDEAATPGAPGRRPALSPSRASDFKQCPLLYRLRAIDRLPEPSSPAQVRGSVVHGALERLYALPAASRDPATAMTLVDPAWDEVNASDRSSPSTWTPRCRRSSAMRRRALPSRLLPAGGSDPVLPRELRAAGRGGVGGRYPAARLRGPDRRRRHGRVAGGGLQARARPLPPLAKLAEAKAMFQMKFYAVAVLRSRGVLAARLRLLYLADGQSRSWIHARSRRVVALREDVDGDVRAIQSAGVTGDFPPRPSRMCDWCAHHEHCPTFGGTPPPYPGWPVGIGFRGAGA